MRVRVLTLRYDPVLDAFDDTQLVDFSKDRRIVGVREHFFETEAGPRLALVVRYQPAESVAPAAPASAEGGRERNGKWRELLTPELLPPFNALREWRRERARRDGVPPYVICTNRQLALLVRARPQTVAGIGEVEGFGRGKLERYGAEMLALLRETAPEAEARGGTGEAGDRGEGDG